MATLTVRRGPQTGEVFRLYKDTVTIGRGARNDIVFDDNDVSREQCYLVWRDTDYELHDLGSTNGTFVNGQRVNTHRMLHDGNLIELGDHITLEYAHDSVHATTEAPMVETAADPGKVIPIAPGESHQYALVVEIGPNPRRIYSLTDEIITLGRDLSNNIVIQDPEVSRWHLQLMSNADGYSVKDLESTNGSLLNGARLTDSKPLQLFDTVELGTAVRLHYIYDTEEARRRIADEAGGRESDESPTDPKRDTKRLAELQFSRQRSTTQLGTGLSSGALVDNIFCRLCPVRLGAHGCALDTGASGRGHRHLGRSVPEPGQRRLAGGGGAGAARVLADGSRRLAPMPSIRAMYAWPIATLLTARSRCCRCCTSRWRPCRRNWKTSILSPTTPPTSIIASSA